MVFRDPRRSFNPRLTVGESIAEPLRLERSEPMDELGARIVEVVTAVGLSPDVLQPLPRELIGRRSCSGWRSRARWSRGPSWWCSTSRWRRSISRRAARCWCCSTGCAPISA